MKLKRETDGKRVRERSKMSEIYRGRWINREIESKREKEGSERESG